MVQTLNMSIKLYAADAGQRDWDEYAERLKFAINNEQDRLRKENTF